MTPIGKIYQIENGFLLELDEHTVIYCKDHKEIAEMIISKRVAEKLREYPQQLELPLEESKPYKNTQGTRKP